MGDIKEISEAMMIRARSPVFGYFSLSFTVTNWKPIFYLFFANDYAQSRIDFFEANTSITSLLWIPLVISIIAALAYPWVQYFFLRATSSPIKRRNKLNAIAESDLLLEKLDLENKRNELIRQKELQVIEKAKIDETVESLGSEEAREKAKKEIQTIREREDILQLPINRTSLEKFLLARFPNHPIDERIVEIFLRDIDLEKYNSIRDIDEALEKSVDFIETYKNEHPELFKSSIDYVTKAFGYTDPEFRAKHGFAEQTKRAIKKHMGT